MPRYDRTGWRIGTVKLGRWACLRQEWVLPGESISAKLEGAITMAALREPLSMDIFGSMAMFYTPTRFLVDSWPTWVHQGIDGDFDMPEYTVPTASPAAAVPWDSLGIGTVFEADSICEIWPKNWLSIYNWYMAWPEDAQRTLSALAFTSPEMQWGPKAVSLESYGTRLRTETLDDSDKKYSAAVDGSSATCLLYTSPSPRDS